MLNRIETKVRRVKRNQPRLFTDEEFDIYVSTSMRSVYYVVEDGVALAEFYYWGNNIIELDNLIRRACGEARLERNRRFQSNKNVQFVEQILESETVNVDVTDIVYNKPIGT